MSFQCLVSTTSNHQRKLGNFSSALCKARTFLILIARQVFRSRVFQSGKLSGSKYADSAKTTVSVHRRLLMLACCFHAATISSVCDVMDFARAKSAIWISPL